MSDEEQEFICPECGSKRADVVTMISPYTPGPSDYDEDEDNPWNGVLETTTCADCDAEIPAHLAQRWDGRSYEDAQQEWRDVYRKC